MPRQALVFEAHDYALDEPTCACADAADHAPCRVCGAGGDAFIHTEEGHLAGASLTVITDVDTGNGSETSAS